MHIFVFQENSRSVIQNKGKMTRREMFLVALCLALAAALFAVTYFGCRCKWEHFEDAAPKVESTSKDAKVDKDMQLSPKEEELFADIQSGKIGDEDIQKLIDKGQITEKMVEKFLAKLDFGGELASFVGTVAKDAQPAATSGPEPEKDEGFEIEGFEAGSMSPAKWK